MSAKTIFPGGNSQFLPALAGLAGTVPVPITASTITASNNITSTTGNIVATTGDISAGGTITSGGMECDTLTVNGTVFTEILTASTGDITATAGDIVATAGNITAGTNLIATDNVLAQTGDVSSAAGSVNAGTSITAGTTITATAGNITATNGNINAPLGSISAGGVITASGGLTIGVGSTTTFLRFGKITTDWAGIPSNSGVAGTAVALVEQQNYQFDSTGFLVWDTLEVLIGNCVPAGDGALIVACITLQAPENGTDGYVNLSFSFINTTDAEVVPASCSFILYSV